MRARSWRAAGVLVPALVPVLVLMHGAAAAAIVPEKAPDRELALRFVTQAERCFGQHDMACALEQVRKALITDKTLLQAHLLLPQVLLEGGNATAAETAVERALANGLSMGDLAATLARARLLQGHHEALLSDDRLQPEKLWGAGRRTVRLARAQARFELGDAQAALAELDRLRAEAPDTPELPLAEVPIRLRLGQTTQALAAAEAALQREPGSAQARLTRALVLQEQGSERTLAAFDDALAADPKLLEARIGRAQWLLTQQRWDLLAPTLAQLVADKVQDPRVAYLQAMDADRRGDRAATTAALRQVTAQIDPQPEALIRFKPRLLLLNGLAHFGLGELDRARSSLELYRKSYGPGLATTLLARLNMAEHKPEQSIAQLEATLREQPRDAQALQLLGSARLAAGDPAQAAALMREALRSQDSPAFYTTLGQALLRQGQFDDGVRALQTALKKDGQQTEAALSLAQAWLERGDAASLQSAQALLAEQMRRQPRVAPLRVRAAQLRLATGDLAGAQALLQEALTLDGGLLQAQLLLAETERRQGHVDAAVTRLTAMARADQAPVDTGMALAAIEEDRGRLPEAQGWLERAAAKAPKGELRPLAAQVELWLRQRRPADAGKAAKALLAAAPENVAALLLASRAALAQGDAAGARPWLVQAGRLSGNDLPGLWATTRLQIAAGDLRGARYTLGKALQIQPELMPLQTLQFELELRDGQPEAAEALARKLVRQQPRSAQAHSLLGQAAIARQRPREAITELAEAHRLAPSSESVLRLWAAQVGQVPPERNVALLEQWLSSHADDAVVRNALAEALVAMGRLPDARRHYERLLQQTGSNAVRNNLAEVLAALKDPSAVTIAEQALRQEPGNPNVLDTAGWILAQAGQTERALGLLRDARARSPESAVIHHHLASVLAASGRREEALQEVRAALADSRARIDRPAAEALLKSLQAAR